MHDASDQREKKRIRSRQKGQRDDLEETYLK